MTLALAVLLLAVVVLFVFGLRQSDLPAAEPVPPDALLQERRARIYENLRDLQFEYRLGKLSDDDYQKSKLELQRELAQVLASMDKGAQPAAGGPSTAGSAAGSTAAEAAAPDPLACPHCEARFEQPMKFCGQCGKPMEASS